MVILEPRSCSHWTHHSVVFELQTLQLKSYHAQYFGFQGDLEHSILLELSKIFQPLKDKPQKHTQKE